MAKSEQNMKFVKLLESLKGQGEILEHLANIDIDKAWQKLQLKISEQKHSGNKRPSLKKAKNSQR